MNYRINARIGRVHGIVNDIGRQVFRVLSAQKQDCT